MCRMYTPGFLIDGCPVIKQGMMILPGVRDASISSSMKGCSV